MKLCIGHGKLSSATLLFLTVFVAGMFNPIPAYADKYWGDANDDGVVNSADAIVILKFAVHLIDPNPSDIHRNDIAPPHSDGTFGDGKIDISDAIRLLKKAVAVEVQPWPHNFVRITLSKAPVAQDADSLDILAEALKGKSQETLYKVVPVPGQPGKFIGIRDLSSLGKETGEITKIINTGLAQSDEKFVELIEPDVLNFVRPASASEYTGTSILPIPNGPLNDTDFAKQWDLSTIDALSGWQVTAGSENVVIAVLDSGIDRSNLDLQQKVLSDSKNFLEDKVKKDADGNITDNGQTDVTDDYGHGTHVAAIAAATANNNLGIAGICQQCSLLIGRIIDKYGSGRKSLSIAGIRWVTDWASKPENQGKRVVLNLSYGDDDEDNDEKDAVSNAISNGVVIVAAAGNEYHNSPMYPAAYPGVLSVEASGPDDKRVSFSNYGNWVSVAAPGVGIFSLLPPQSVLGILHGSESAINGTSQATPLVSGLAALVLSKDPTLTPDQVKSKIIDNADVIQVEGDPTIHRINVGKTLGFISNHPPVVASQNLTTPEDTPLSVTLTGNDLDAGQTLTYQIVSQPTHGTLSGTAPNLTYSPSQDYIGPDSFTFSDTDNGNPPLHSSSDGTVSINVTSVNDAPVIILPTDPQNGKVGQLLTLNISATDVDNSNLTFSSSNLPTGATITPVDGTHAIFNWTPTSGQEGDSNISFTASDGALADSKSVAVHIEISTPDMGKIFTVAGNGQNGNAGDGGPAISAQVGAPFGVAVDEGGNIFIADDNGLIRKVNTDGIITTVAGGGNGLVAEDGKPATSSQLKLPWGVAVDSKGNIYIAEAETHRIRKVGPDGIITTVAGSGPVGNNGAFSGDGGPATSARLDNPRGVAIDNNSNLFIADSGNHRIRKVGSDGIITTVVGSGPTGFGNGSGYFGDGGPATSAGITAPSSVAVDNAGNLFVVEGPRVRKINTQGIITTIAGGGTPSDGVGDGGPATSAYLYAPYGVAVDSGDNIFIGDDMHHRVRKVTADGIISTIAGTGETGSSSEGGFSGDGGPATLARLNRPFGVAVDPMGNLLIADTFNLRIRKVIGIAASKVTTGIGKEGLIFGLGPVPSETGLKVNDNTAAFAVSFVATIKAQITHVEFPIRVTHPRNDSLKVDIYTDKDNKIGDLIGSSALIPGSSIQVDNSIRETWVNFVFSNPVTIDIQQRYWIVITSTGDPDGNNYYLLGWSPTPLGGSSYSYAQKFSSGWIYPGDNGSLIPARLYGLMPHGTETIVVQNNVIANTAYGLLAGDSRLRIAQTFKESDSHIISKVGFVMNGTSTGSKNVFVEIRDDSDNKPGSTVLATSATIAQASITGGENWYDFSFPTPFKTVGGTKYWLVLTENDTTPSQPQIVVKASSSDDTYPNGSGLSEIAPDNWQVLQDYLFRIYGID
jgi:subtilisin family serine protease